MIKAVKYRVWVNNNQWYSTESRNGPKYIKKCNTLERGTQINNSNDQCFNNQVAVWEKNNGQ